MAIGRVTTLDAVVAGAVAEPLRLRFFLSLLGALALVIGAVGIYSVVSYSVTRRRAEFGVRLALGAAPRRILSEVVSGGLAPVGIGIVAGLAGTLALGASVGRFLYGVTPADGLSLAAAAGALLARRDPGGGGAGPARRAHRSGHGAAGGVSRWGRRRRESRRRIARPRR